MRYLMCAAAILCSTSALGQQVTDVEGPVSVFAGVRFFIVLVTGVVLAMAFQVLLTNLGLALGLNIAGSKTSPDKGRERPASSKSSGSDVHSAIRSITMGFGLAAMVSAGIALFFGTWIAMTLTPYPGAWQTVALALTIWGVFYVTVAAIDFAVTSSLLGALIRYATGALRTVAQAAGASMAGPDEAKLAQSVTDSVQRELLSSENMSAMRAQVQKWVDQFEPKEPDDRVLRSEFAKILSDEEIQYLVQDGHIVDRDEIVGRFRRQGRFGDKARDMTGRVEEALKSLREDDGNGGGSAEKGTEAAMRAAGLSREEAKEFRKKAENWLRSTGKSELNPEGIKRDLEQLVRDPRGGLERMAERLGQMDRSTVESILAQRKDVSPEEAKKAVDQIESAVAVLTERTQTAGSGAKGQATAVAEKAKAVPEQIRRKLQNYLDSLGRPELRYEGIEQDIRLLFQDPRAGAEELYERLRSMDRETLKAIVASRRDMSEEDAEHLVRKLEEARDSALGTVEKAKQKITEGLERARREALRQADETRRDAAVAAWWGVGIALVTAGLAVLGAFVPVWA